MLRSTHCLLRQAAARLQPRRPLPASSHAPLASLAARASSTGSASSNPSDYDRIMRGQSYSSAAEPSSLLMHYSTGPSASASPIAGQEAASSGCMGSQGRYRTVDEPTGGEDYDGHELHHPPCERTRAAYYDAGIDSGGEMGSIL
ncbi:hypothetical protein ACHAXT_011342 [Thalassiosira profunda]